MTNEIWVGFLNDCFTPKALPITVVMKNNYWMFEVHGSNGKYGNMLSHQKGDNRNKLQSLNEFVIFKSVNWFENNET